MTENEHTGIMFRFTISVSGIRTIELEFVM